ncbi:RNA-binding domain-containing protein [Thermoproteota archaeon]
MSRPRIVRQAEIAVFTHATEDRSKVLKAVRNLFPKNIEFPNYTEFILDGYFGDPIITLHFIVKNRRTSSELFDNLVNGLSSLDYLMLLDDLPQRIGKKKKLYLRLDKQKAYLGYYVLEQHDPIRVKISLLLPHKTDPAGVLKEYMEKMRG